MTSGNAGYMELGCTQAIGASYADEILLMPPKKLSNMNSTSCAYSGPTLARWLMRCSQVSCDLDGGLHSVQTSRECTGGQDTARPPSTTIELEMPLGSLRSSPSEQLPRITCQGVVSAKAAAETILRARSCQIEDDPSFSSACLACSVARVAAIIIVLGAAKSSRSAVSWAVRVYSTA